MLSEWLPFGVLRRPHGVAGEIALEPFNQVAGPPALRVPLDVQLRRGAEVRGAVVAKIRPVHDGFLLRFVDVDGRDAAAALTGFEMLLPRASLAALSAGEFYVADAVGCEVVRVDGTSLGRVTGTFWNGAQDILSVVDSEGVERLVPAIAPCLQRFDSQLRRLIVDFHE